MGRELGGGRDRRATTRCERARSTTGRGSPPRDRTVRRRVDGTGDSDHPRIVNGPALRDAGHARQPRSDVFNLGDVSGEHGEAFARSYIENSLTACPSVAPHASKLLDDLGPVLDMASGHKPVEADGLQHSWDGAELDATVRSVAMLRRAQDVLLKVNAAYIASAATAEEDLRGPDAHRQGRAEPAGLPGAGRTDDRRGSSPVGRDPGPGRRRALPPRTALVVWSARSPHRCGPPRSGRPCPTRLTMCRVRFAGSDSSGQRPKESVERVPPPHRRSSCS